MRRTMSRIPETPENRRMQDEIRNSAYRALVRLGISCIARGSGRFVDLTSDAYRAPYWARR